MLVSALMMRTKRGGIQRRATPFKPMGTLCSVRSPFSSHPFCFSFWTEYLDGRGGKHFRDYSQSESPLASIRHRSRLPLSHTSPLPRFASVGERYGLDRNWNISKMTTKLSAYNDSCLKPRNLVFRAFGMPTTMKYFACGAHIRISVGKKINYPLKWELSYNLTCPLWG